MNCGDDKDNDATTSGYPMEERSEVLHTKMLKKKTEGNRKKDRMKINKLLHYLDELVNSLRELQEREVDFENEKAEFQMYRHEQQLQDALRGVVTELINKGAMNTDGMDESQKRILNGLSPEHVVVANTGNELLNRRLTDKLQEQQNVKARQMKRPKFGTNNAPNLRRVRALTIEETADVCRQVRKCQVHAGNSTNIPDPDQCEHFDKFVTSVMGLVVKALRESRLKILNEDFSSVLHGEEIGPEIDETKLSSVPAAVTYEHFVMFGYAHLKNPLLDNYLKCGYRYMSLSTSEMMKNGNREAPVEDSNEDVIIDIDKESCSGLNEEPDNKEGDDEEEHEHDDSQDEPTSNEDNNYTSPNEDRTILEMGALLNVDEIEHIISTLSNDEIEDGEILSSQSSASAFSVEVMNGNTQQAGSGTGENVLPVDSETAVAISCPVPPIPVCEPMNDDGDDDDIIVDYEHIVEPPLDPYTIAVKQEKIEMVEKWLSDLRPESEFIENEIVHLDGEHEGILRVHDGMKKEVVERCGSPSMSASDSSSVEECEPVIKRVREEIEVIYLD